MEPLVDSHLHFDEFAREGVLDELIRRAVDAGVHGMVAVGGSPSANELSIGLSRQFPGRVFCTAGYDRDLAGTNPDRAELERMVEEGGVRAIGETGLDYHYEPEKATEQIELFRMNLSVAAAHGLPVIVHTREADEDTVEHLRWFRDQFKGPADRVGVVHCFTGDRQLAFRLLDLGFHLGFSGIVTFRNAGDLRAVAAAVPVDRVLIETDAPYLAPVPMRGKRNEPAFVRHVAESMAALRGLPLDEAARITRQNAVRLFELDLAGK